LAKDKNRLGVVRIVLKYPKSSNISNLQIPDMLSIKVIRRIISGDK
jgi:hypothetical protein